MKHLQHACTVVGGFVFGFGEPPTGVTDTASLHEVDISGIDAKVISSGKIRLAR